MIIKRFLLLSAVVFAAVVQFRPQPAEAAIYNSFSALQEGEQFGQDVMFSSVGLFVGTDLLGDDYIAGSGVLIDPYWVLTAGHVPFADPAEYWQSMKFNPSADVGANLDRFVGAAAWYTFPGYESDVGAGRGADIGLVRLAEPIFTVQSAARFYGEDLEGTEMVMAGYGNPGVWPNALGPFDGIRRAGQNIGDSFGYSSGLSQWEEQYWVADLDISQFQNPFPLEWNASKNDSGGGWFAEIDGTMQLVGIHSFSGGGVDGGATLSGAVRVSLYNDWIDDTMSQHAVPEPASALMFTLGLLGFGARRIQRKIS